MKNPINWFLSIILTITIILVLICFTLLNNNYVKHIFNKYNYYDRLYEENKNDYEDLSECKYYINKYIDSKYKTSLKENSFSKFINKYQLNKYYVVIYIGTILMIIITGCLMNKTKKKHKLDLIIFISSILLIMIFGICVINNKISNEIIYRLIDGSVHYLLAMSVVMLEYSIYKFIKIKYVKK